MKLLFFILILFITFSSPAQDEPLSENAKKIISLKFPLATSVKGYRKNDSVYFAEIINDWKKHEILIDAASNSIISTKTPKEIPESIIKKISFEYPAYSPEEFEIKKRGGKIFYEIELSKGDDEIEITISENGEIVEKDEK